MTYKYLLSPILLKNLAQAVMCLIDILEVPILNLGRNTGYPEGGVAWLSLVCPGYYIKLCHRRILPQLSNSLLTNDPFNSTLYTLPNQQRR
jgi:hypothetical protein